MKAKKIKKYIRTENGKALSSVFCLGPFEAVSSIDYKELSHPFDKLFHSHLLLLKEGGYKNSENTLKCINDILEEGIWTYIVCKRIIANTFSYLKEKSRTEENKESLAKTLLSIYRNSKNHPIKDYIVNLLFKLYFEMNKIELAESLLLISNNNRRGKKDYYIYNMYKGFLLSYKDNFSEAYKCFKIAFKSKKIKNKIALPFFIVSMLNNRFPKEKVLRKYNCIVLQKFCYCIRYGLYPHIEEVILSNKSVLDKYNMFRIAHTYFPLLTFNYLVKRIYCIKSKDSKLSIYFIQECLKTDLMSVFSLLFSVIEFDLLKGYVSVNKNMVVFSRVDPFPFKLS